MDADVAVIGGGPAGSTAATALRRSGCSVVLINVERPRTGGETSSAALVELIRNVGAGDVINAVLRPCFGLVASWGSPHPSFRSSIATRHGHSFFIDRPGLDSALRNVAREAGVDVRYGKVSRIVRSPAGVIVDLGTSGLPLNVRAIVDATGRGARIARALGAVYHLFDPLVAVLGCLPARTEEQIVMVEAVAEGWWYALSTGDQQSTVGFVTRPSVLRGLRLWDSARWQAALRKTSMISPLIASDIQPGGISISPTGSARLNQVAGDRWLAVGDAAMAFDPVASVGVVNALASGWSGRRALASWLDGNPQELHHYSERADVFFRYYEKKRAAHYRFERRWANSPFWGPALPGVELLN